MRRGPNFTLRDHGVNARLAQCLNSVLNVKAVVAAFNQEKALLGAFSVITNLRMELFEALIHTATHSTAGYFALHCSLARTLFAFSPIFADLE